MNTSNKAYRNILLPAVATVSLMIGSMSVAEAWGHYGYHRGYHHGYYHAGYRHAYGWHNGWNPVVNRCVWVPAYRTFYGHYVPAHRRC